MRDKVDRSRGACYLQCGSENVCAMYENRKRQRKRILKQNGNNCWTFIMSIWVFLTLNFAIFWYQPIFFLSPQVKHCDLGETVLIGLPLGANVWFDGQLSPDFLNRALSYHSWGFLLEAFGIRWQSIVFSKRVLSKFVVFFCSDFVQSHNSMLRRVCRILLYSILYCIFNTVIILHMHYFSQLNIWWYLVCRLNFGKNHECSSLLRNSDSSDLMGR